MVTVRNPGFGAGTVKLSIKIPQRLSKKISPYVVELNHWIHREGEAQLTDELLIIEIRDLLTLWLQLDKRLGQPADRAQLIEIFRGHVLEACGPTPGMDGAKILKVLEESEAKLPASAFTQPGPTA